VRPVSAAAKVREHVYKINLLSDAIKYLSSGSPRRAGARVRHSPSHHPSPSLRDFVFAGVSGVSFFFFSRAANTARLRLALARARSNFGMMHGRLSVECKLKTDIAQATKARGAQVTTRGGSAA